MAKYKKKRARELQHDRFRDTANTLLDRLGNRLEGKGKAILYGIVGVVLLGVLVGVWVKWSSRKADEARRALGREARALARGGCAAAYAVTAACTRVSRGSAIDSGSGSSSGAGLPSIR